LQKSEE
jgi:hypothetical protein